MSVVIPATKAGKKLTTPLKAAKQSNACLHAWLLDRVAARGSMLLAPA